MKVVLIYRKPSPGAYSIEELFRSLGTELSERVELIEYTLGGAGKLVSDLIALRRMNADIYHVTGGSHFVAALLPSRRTLLTVHDVGHFLNGLSGIRKWIYGLLWFRLPLRRLKLLAVISERTKRDVVRSFKVEPDRITVIQNWLRPEFQPLSCTRKSDMPVILQIGCKPNKNVHRLVEAISGLDCELWIIGALPEFIQAELKRQKVSFENWSNLTNQELLERYADCDVVALVSTFEGFGMPIIEAQAVGRAVITSDISPMAEVAGEGACLVDAFDVDAIHAALARLLSDHEYRDQVIRNGLKNAERYNVTLAAELYMERYCRLAALAAANTAATAQ